MEIPAGYAQVNLLFGGTTAPQGAEVAFGVRLDDPADEPDDVATQVLSAVTTSTLMANFVNTLVLTGAKVKFGPSLTGPSAEVSSNLVGGSSGAGAPPNVALLIRKGTAAGGRAGRGRMYWPGLQEGPISADGLITTTYQADLQTDFAEFATLLGLSGLPMVLLHSAGAPISVPSLVTSLSVDRRVATQRRRLRG